MVRPLHCAPPHLVQAQARTAGVAHKHSARMSRGKKAVGGKDSLIIAVLVTQCASRSQRVASQEDNGVPARTVETHAEARRDQKPRPTCPAQS
jgi:hypothetical protein